MNKLSKFLGFVLILALALSLAACGGVGGSGEESKTQSVESVESIESTESNPNDGNENESNEGGESDGEGEKPEGSESTGEGEKPEGSESTGEGEKPEGSESTGEGEKPEGSESTGEGEKPEGSESTGEGEKPEGSESTGEGEKPEGSESTGEGEKPEGSESTGEGEKPEGSDESIEGGDQDPKYGTVYVKLYFTADGVIEKSFSNDEDGMTVNEVLEKISADDSLTYAGNYTLNEFAVYNAGEEITDGDYVLYDGGNYLAVIAKDAIETDITVRFTGYDSYGSSMDRDVYLYDVTTLMEVIYQSGLSISDFTFEVYGEKVGELSQGDDYQKYDFASVMIFADAQITVYPIYNIRVSMDGFELSARFEKEPTLGEVIKAIGLEEERDDYLWTVNGYVTQDYQSSIGYLGESIRAEKKKIGVYVNFVDEMGNDINIQPNGYFIEKNSATVRELLDFNGLFDIEGYTWEIEFKNINNETERFEVNLDYVVKYVYDADAQSNGYYSVYFYGKTSTFTLNLWSSIIGVGEKYQTLQCSEPITVAGILEALEITVNFEDLHIVVTPVEGSGYEISSLDDEILFSATVNVYDQREYVNVNVKVDGTWVNKQILSEGLTTVGQAITAAGFNYSDYSWTITRQGINLYNETIPVMSENEAIQNYDLIKGEVLESINVFFSGVMDYGYMDTDDGTGYKAYSTTDSWDNPTIEFMTKGVFNLLGWSLEESNLTDTKQPKIITSLDELFALNLREVTVYPVIDIVYEGFNGLYYNSMDGMYIKLENGYASGFYFNYTEFVQYTAEQFQVTDYEYFAFYISAFNNSFYINIENKQSTGSFIYVETRETDGNVGRTVIETAQQLNDYLEYANSYTIIDGNGKDITDVDQIIDGEIYYVYIYSEE